MSQEPRHRRCEYRGTNRTRRDVLRGLGLGAGLALAGCVASGESRGTDAEATLTRHLGVTVDHRPEELAVTVPADTYRQIGESPHSIPAGMVAARDRPFLDRIGAELMGQASDRTAAIHAAQSLTATIEYVTDLDSTGRAEFVRYPSETVVETEGDCEDKAILLAGILASDSLDCRTALLFPRGHCATLVARADLPADARTEDPLTVSLDGTEFVYVEAVEAVEPGLTARDYGTRERLAAYTDGWHVLDASAVVATVENELGRRLRTIPTAV